MGLSPSQVKPMTMKLVFAASPLSMQHEGVRADWLARIMCLNGRTCLPADCCFNELALKIQLSMLFSTKRMLSSSSYYYLALKVKCKGFEYLIVLLYSIKIQIFCTKCVTVYL